MSRSGNHIANRPNAVGVYRNDGSLTGCRCNMVCMWFRYRCVGIRSSSSDRARSNQLLDLPSWVFWQEMLLGQQILSKARHTTRIQRHPCYTTSDALNRIAVLGNKADSEVSSCERIGATQASCCLLAIICQNQPGPRKHSRC